jgi:hypothetical protein
MTHTIEATKNWKLSLNDLLRGSLKGSQFLFLDQETGTSVQATGFGPDGRFFAFLSIRMTIASGS